MQTPRAVFVGIGTAVAAIAVGLSGGLITNVMSPQPLKQGVETARPELAPPEQMPASDAVPYVGAALAFVDPSIGGGAAAHHQKAAANNPAPRTVQAAEASGDQAARPADTPASTSETEGPQQGATDEAAASAPENAYANARAADSRRGAERRRAERAQRWAYRHRRDWDQYRYSYDQQQRNDGDWYSGRRYHQNYYYAQQPRYDNPQFRSFGPD